MLSEKVIPYLFFLVCGITFYSCKYDVADALPCSNNPHVVSFTSDVLPLLRTECSTAGCHSGSNPEGNLNLEDAVAYDELWKPGRGYINTSKPEFSLLYTQMISASQPMPPTGKLHDCKIHLILKWIEQGALRN